MCYTNLLTYLPTYLLNATYVQTLLRHTECSSARTNRDTVVEEMKRALDMIQLVVTDSVVAGGDVGKDQHRDNHSHSPPLSVNAADSGISLSQLQTTTFKAIKDFDVIFLYFIIKDKKVKVVDLFSAST